ERRRSATHAQFAQQARLVVDVAQGLGDGGGRNRHRAVQLAVVAERAAQRVDVAVEGGADHFTLGVDHRRAGVPADDVVGRDEVVDDILVDPVLGGQEAFGGVERLGAGGALV